MPLPPYRYNNRPFTYQSQQSGSRQAPSTCSCPPARGHFDGSPLQVRYLERQLELAQQSSEVEGGAIEVLEGLLRKRDTDKQLYHSLGLKSMEISLKMRLLETDNGGKTVEVGRTLRAKN